MAYIDKTYYRTTYKGVAVSDDTTLETLILRAEEVIDSITNDSIVLKGFANYSAYIQTKIKLATCKQVEYYAINGYQSSISDTDTNVSIGSFSISKVDSKKSVKNGYCLDAVNLLASVGLIARGVDVCY